MTIGAAGAGGVNVLGWQQVTGSAQTLPQVVPQAGAHLCPQQPWWNHGRRRKQQRRSWQQQPAEKNTALSATRAHS